jgi:hypothetical protein
MIAEEEVEQLQLFGPGIDTIASIRETLRAKHSDRFVIDARTVTSFTTAAALRGAGFTSATEVPAELLSRVRDNEEFFWMDTKPGDDEYHLSTRSFVMSRERYIERFAHRFDLVGGTSIKEYVDYEEVHNDDRAEARNG